MSKYVLVDGLYIPNADWNETDNTKKSYIMNKPTVIPIGTVLSFAGNTSPVGFLFCDGSAVSRTDYSDLFSVINVIYGSGDGSTTFNLPNLIDKFIEGSSTAGTSISAGLPDIQGTIHPVYEDNYLPSPTGAFKRSGTAYEADGTSYTSEDKGYEFKASYYNSIYGNSETVQPPSLTMRYIIKY